MELGKGLLEFGAAMGGGALDPEVTRASRCSELRTCAGVEKKSSHREGLMGLLAGCGCRARRWGKSPEVAVMARRRERRKGRGKERD